MSLREKGMKFDLTIIASGDSLRGFDFSQVSGPIWAINYTGKHLHEMGIKVDRLLCFDRIRPDYPKKLYIDTIVPHGGRWFNRGEKLNRQQDCVANLNSSTIFAINVALQEGYKRIAVLGADQQGVRHWYDPIEHSQTWNFDLFNKFFWIVSNQLLPGEMVYLVESAAKWPKALKLSMKQYKEIIGYE